ncbi:protein kinase receptor Ret oncogene [Nomia melanderi]|uniref:protein kinase receptor Ret oncogene n=1 Tax=Nomia melanderi TaxID=2448451 RepID=UPI003FCEB848
MRVRDRDRDRGSPSKLSKLSKPSKLSKRARCLGSRGKDHHRRLRQADEKGDRSSRRGSIGGHAEDLERRTARRRSTVPIVASERSRNQSGTMAVLLLLLLQPSRTPASELYFPQSDLTVRVPVSSRNVELLHPRTLREDSTESKGVSYRATVARHGDVASIDGETKALLLHRVPDELEPVTIVLLAKENGSSSTDRAVSEIRVWPILEKRINCSDHVQDMCFWDASRYRIYENQPSTMIGTFGPRLYADLCPSFRVTGYNLLNGTDYFSAVNDTLFANPSLDRDALGPPPAGPGPRVTVQVRCVVWDELTGVQYAPIKLLHVDVLDQDDNPPIAQNGSIWNVTAGNTLVAENTLILKDADANSSNRYAMRILGDVHDALNVSFSTALIEKPKLVPYTAIFAVIFAKTTPLPKSPYRVTLQVQDETLLPGHGENTLNITVNFYGSDHRASTTTASSVASRQPFSYPSTVRIARVATRYSRVARPSSEPAASISFGINGSTAFAVTPRGGIVYVADERRLETEPDNLLLTIKWSKSSAASSSRTIRVNLSTVPAAKVDACNRTERSHSCANAETAEDCESSCGLASGVFSKGSYSGRCAWRRSKRSNDVSGGMSDHYPTCSPDLTHCPDNRCDELEQLDPRICPQDCAPESNVHFAHANKNGRGIKSGAGTCACDDMLQCTCNVEQFSARSDHSGRDKDAADGKFRERENENLVSDARKEKKLDRASGPCGPFCMIGAIGGSFFVLIAIVGSFVTSRYRMSAKGTRREGKRRTGNGDAIAIGASPSDRMDRGDGLFIGLDTFTAANRHLLLPKSYPVSDPKWEFPRSRLTIEQVLGEGEFGRVLRAEAIDIEGAPGPTTVAVKTLKENACASELADLLSEYQLLKEVQHPNVIRLLGACTTPGAPVYLIIEFAEFGSLRNYLRRSRHLDSEGRHAGGCSSLSNVRDDGSRIAESDETTANVESDREADADANAAPTSIHTVTSRDILSFAWQISKGMAYLAEIKLVHRDLAARNVLLATGKVCKISDFGLTRDVYEDDAYLKRSKGRVPVKWMAPESLADHVYTSKSDVWSFGVLLWELVTLGASPYPGVDVHNLYNLLKAGYRMERPANCSQQLYKLMVSCWHQEPGSRPSFKELTGHWERMLEDSIDYLDLNPRTVQNRSYFASLHALDSPSSSGNEEPDDPTTGEHIVFGNNALNYLEKPSFDTVTKSDKIDKLHTLWQAPVASFPDERIKPSYVNEQRANLRKNHYESPIKFARNASVASDSENDLVTPTNERPHSYIDMEGKKFPESENLLVLAGERDRKNEREDN